MQENIMHKVLEGMKGTVSKYCKVKATALIEWKRENLKIAFTMGVEDE